MRNIKYNPLKNIGIVTFDNYIDTGDNSYVQWPFLAGQPRPLSHTILRD